MTSRPNHRHKAALTGRVQSRNNPDATTTPEPTSRAIVGTCCPLPGTWIEPGVMPSEVKSRLRE